MEAGVVAGVVAIGLIHGVLPDHGWPIAATYALNRPQTRLYGVLAGLVLGIGHLISSIALVVAYYGFSNFSEFAEGPWLKYTAGTILILLGIYEYTSGGHHGSHEHGDGDGHDHGHDHDHGTEHEHNGTDGHSHGQEHGHEHSNGHDHDHGHGHGHDGAHEHGHEDAHPHGHDHANDRGPGHTHDHGQDHAHDDNRAPDHDTSGEGDRGIISRLRARFGRDSGHRHLDESHAERGLAALGMTALLLGFAHEEPIQILAICVGTPFCLELMLIYSLAVIVAILTPTMVLIAGYERHQDVVERYTPYFPAVTGVVLVGMGLAFIIGII